MEGGVLREGKQEAELGGIGKGSEACIILGKWLVILMTAWISFKLWTCANFDDLPYSDLR